jgi:replicative DNA helicase
MISYEGFSDDVFMNLEEEDFYFEWARAIYRTAKPLHDENKLHIGALMTRMELNNEIDAVGGREGLNRVFSQAISIYAAREYIPRVKFLSAKRKMIEVAERLKAEALGTEITDLGELMTLANLIVTGFEHTSESDTYTIQEVWGEMTKELRNKTEVKAPKMNIPSLDYFMNGLHRQRFIAIAGRPGAGKTALALQTAYQVSTQGFGVVPYFSMEMPKMELSKRLASNLSGVPFGKVINNATTEEDNAKIDKAETDIKNSKLIVFDKSAMTIGYIESQCRRLKRKHGELGLIVIDHLLLMNREERRTENTQAAIGRITYAFKNLAKEMDCAIMLLTQMNREIEKRSDKRPSMSDLRDSGSIEQDADMVAFLINDEEKSDGRLDPVDFIVTKGRWTGIKDIKLMFAKQIQRINTPESFCRS